MHLSDDLWSRLARLDTRWRLLVESVYYNTGPRHAHRRWSVTLTVSTAVVSLIEEASDEVGDGTVARRAAQLNRPSPDDDTCTLIARVL